MAQREASDTPRAADYRIQVLSAILGWAKKARILKENNALGIEKLGNGAGRAEFIWSDELFKRMWDVASTDVRHAMMLALWTGQRQGDLLRLPWSAYDKEIRLKQSKGKKNVLVPVYSRLKTHLDEMKRENPIILTNSHGQPWTSDGFRTAWSKTKAKAAITDRTFHDLRGTAVTIFAMAGITIPEIASITGHSLAHVTELLDKNYLGDRAGLARPGILKLETRLGEAK